MPDVADEVIEAAKYFSLRENTEVEVEFCSGERTLYVEGKAVDTPVSHAAPMPFDMTPKTVRLGHWHQEAEKFIESISYCVSDFLDLYREGLRRASK